MAFVRQEARTPRRNKTLMDTSSQIFINCLDSNRPLSQKDINHEETKETSPQIFLLKNQSRALYHESKTNHEETNDTNKFTNIFLA